MHNTKLRILTRNEVHQLRPPDYLVPRILPREGFVYLVAPPSSKKTFVAIELAACVATGQPFLASRYNQAMWSIWPLRDKPV
jgi:hypothetical protein